MRRWLLLISLALLTPTVLLGAVIINVPADYSTIQAAINAASDTDTILVAAGTYSGPGNRDIDFGGKKIFVKAVPTTGSAVIDCGGSASEHHLGFIFHSGETISSSIQGFKITGAYLGNPYPDTAAIYCVGSSPGILNCIVTGNSCTGIGSYANAHPVIRNCVISLNSGDGVSAGAPLWPMSWVDMYGCLVYANSEHGLNLVSPGTFTIEKCTIVMNKLGGVFLEGDPPKSGAADMIGLFTKCVVAYNRSYGFQRGFWYPGLTLTCNDAFGNTGINYSSVFASPGDTLNNISADPKFCDTTFADFHISDLSPCVAANNNCNTQIGAYGIACSIPFICGDFNGDNAGNITDVVALVQYIFAGGPPPWLMAAADVNGDGHLNISDAVAMIIFIFAGGPLNCPQ